MKPTHNIHATLTKATMAEDQSNYPGISTTDQLARASVSMD
ncbi:hypothetical protein Gotur_008637 [Gossypium turneri]